MSAAISVTPSTVAIVGASPDPTRYAYQAVVRYRERGWTVWTVHPRAESVLGCPAFATVSALPARPDIVCMYVNPQLGLTMLPAIAALDPAHPPLLWLNPGADDDALTSAAQAHGLEVVRACTLVVLAHGDPRQARREPKA